MPPLPTMPTEELLQTETAPTPVLETPPAPAATNEDLANVKKALEKEREDRRRLEKQLKTSERRFEAVKDIDPDSYHSAISKSQELEAQQAESSERERLRMQEQEAKYTQQLQQAIAEKEAALKDLGKERHRYALEKFFVASDGLTTMGDDGVSAFDLFWNQLGSRFKIDEETGQMGVIDESGVWVLNNESGQRLAVTDYIEQQKGHPLYGHFFKAKYGSGSGMGQSIDVRGVKGADFGGMSTNEKFAAAFGQTR